ncbi:CBO0543 family protein [Peribacillus sp. SCS-155]|uniref:CBO0543 family protein n=1 Tax=Peribacillus sedimenti TaxID=3115297 RepID=UPI003906CA3C
MNVHNQVITAWSFAVICVVLVVVIIFMPKRISYGEMYVTSYFATFLAAMADMYLDLKWDLYGFFFKGVDLWYIPVFIVVYPAANILYLNFFPHVRSKRKQALYILFCSGLCLLFEWMVRKTILFYYHGWKLQYSAIAYPILFFLLVLNLWVIRKLPANPK